PSGPDQSLPLLAARMSPEDAAKVARRAIDGMTRNATPYTLTTQCEIVAAVTARLEPKAAADLAREAAEEVVPRVAGIAPPFQVTALEEAVGLLAERMKPDEAAVKVEEVLQQAGAAGDGRWKSAAWTRAQGAVLVKLLKFVKPERAAVLAAATARQASADMAN